jgi:hypothetical protein
MSGLAEHQNDDGKQDAPERFHENRPRILRHQSWSRRTVARFAQFGLARISFAGDGGNYTTEPAGPGPEITHPCEEAHNAQMLEGATPLSTLGASKPL